MKELPKITILLATFNRAELISETLDSIVNQTYSNWECIIVDDYSTDTTVEVISKYLEKDGRFSYYLKTDKYQKGLSGTRNYGLDIAATRNAEFIQFFDDDDIMHPRKLELKIEPFLENSDLNFTACKFETIIEDQKGGYAKIISPEFKLLHSHVGDAILLGDLRMNSQSTMWNMSIINMFRFDESLMYAEEWELFTRIGYKYPDNYEVVDEYLFSYRKHSNTLTLGEDLNYEKRKTSAIVRIKIMDYLSENKLHTKESILFLAKTFLITFYNPLYVKELICYIKRNDSFTVRLSWFLKSGLYFAKLHSRFISKLGHWV